MFILFKINENNILSIWLPLLHRHSPLHYMLTNLTGSIVPFNNCFVRHIVYTVTRRRCFIWSGTELCCHIRLAPNLPSSSKHHSPFNIIDDANQPQDPQSLSTLASHETVPSPMQMYGFLPTSYSGCRWQLWTLHWWWLNSRIWPKAYWQILISECLVSSAYSLDTLQQQQELDGKSYYLYSVIGTDTTVVVD